MAGISATRSKKDLQFMAEDVGAELMAYLPPETRMAGLPPETRLAGLPPETRLAGLPPETRLAGLSLEDVLKVFAVDPLLTKLDADQRELLLQLMQTLQSAQKKTNGSHQP